MELNFSAECVAITLKSDSERMATLVDYTFKSLIKLTPG